MTVNEISLFILAAVILIVGLYIDSHRESSRSASANRQADDYRRNRSFYFAGLIALLGWYVDTHSEEKPRYRPKRRR